MAHAAEVKKKKKVLGNNVIPILLQTSINVMTSLLLYFMSYFVTQTASLLDCEAAEMFEQWINAAQC